MKGNGMVLTSAPLFVGLAFGILVLHPTAMLFQCAAGGAWVDRLGRAFLSTFEDGMAGMVLLFAVLGACLAALSQATRSRAAGGTRVSAHVQALQRLCMYCKAMPQRDSDGAEHWLPMEHALHRSWGMEFSHGVCPHCQVQILEPQIAALKKAGGPNLPGKNAPENGP